MFKPTPTQEELEALRTFFESTRYNPERILHASNESYYEVLKTRFPEEIQKIEREVRNSKTKTIYFIHSPEINKN
jgi:hypothetical protein